MTTPFRGALIGAPGSGKGTLASKIMQKYDVFHLCVGDIFRRHVENKTALGESVQKYVTEGKLVPDVLVNRIVLDMMKVESNSNILLDGYPRNKVQGEKLFTVYPLQLVIYLKVPMDVIIKRVSGRWVHPRSGRIYNSIFKPPKVPGIDDITGEPLVQRLDDTPETLQNRLKVFQESTDPLLEFLRKEKVLRQFDASTTREMWLQVDKVLVEFMNPKV